MVLSVLGSSHKARGIKNQDSVLELEEGNKKVRIVCDGCTNIDIKDPKTFDLTHSEIGSGLFLQLYSMIEDPFDSESFIDNANNIMKKMLSAVDYDVNNVTEKVINFINYSYCFTIVACFEEEDKFITYILGDGVIIVENKFDIISFIEIKYGDCPPYLVYNFLPFQDEKLEFERLEFDKSDVNNVGVASDGLMPALGKAVTDVRAKLNFDKAFKSKFLLKKIIDDTPNIFGDDTSVSINLI